MVTPGAPAVGEHDLGAELGLDLEVTRIPPSSLEVILIDWRNRVGGEEEFEALRRLQLEREGC